MPENNNTPARRPGPIVTVIAHGAVVIRAASPIGISTAPPAIAAANSDEPAAPPLRHGARPMIPDADLSPAQSAVMIAMAAIALGIALYILAFAEMDHRRAFARPATRRRADEAWRRAFFAFQLPPPNYAPPAVAGRRPVPAPNAPGSCRRPLLTLIAVTGLALLLTGCGDGEGRRIGVMVASAAVAIAFFIAFAGVISIAMRPDRDPLDDIIGDVPAPLPPPHSRDEGDAS
ncbi:hypothetical protein RA307_26070 [Xanthobacteraceae bacterium Astr-EGSB]|uniref:hypothetical protein n=1 Tax=Astrobacterium formosum TaxID=3069710 RepID=UPI0027AF67C0|nr:hypothetical protein [Xanthobacteraceae bacterium Astr-EGSB]